MINPLKTKEIYFQYHVNDMSKCNLHAVSEFNEPCVFSDNIKVWIIAVAIKSASMI